MPIKISNLNSDPPAPRGIALLITLVIIALLAVYMTEFSFDTHLETRGIRNFQASFKARNAVKSLFKATLVGLQGGLNGEVSEKTFLKINYDISGSYLNPIKPEPLPELVIKSELPGLSQNFPNVIFYTPYIRPIDHLFNLNRIDPKLVPEKKPYLDLYNEFSNIMGTFSKQESSDTNQIQSSTKLSPESIQIIYASLFDWVDNSDFDFPGSNIESHIQIDDTEWEVKNRLFDDLSEILLLQNKLFDEGIFDFIIPLESNNSEVKSWSSFFTVYPVGVQEGEEFGDPRINVNLADSDDIQQFLERFSNPSVDSDKEQQYLNRAADIASVLKPDFSQETPGFKSMNDIKTRLRSDPSTLDLNDYHNNYFILWSNWYDIHLVTEIENVKAEVRAVVEVKRDENGKVEKNDNGEYAITIHEFQLR